MHRRGRGPPTIKVQFSYAGAAQYRFEVDLDGVRHECTASLPLRADAPQSCDDPTLRLTLSGSALPEAEHSIGPLEIWRDDVQRVAVRAFRDESPIGETAFDVKYSTTPGPNGEGCEPEVCHYASGGSL